MHALAGGGLVIGYPLLQECTKCAEDSVLQNFKFKQDKEYVRLSQSKCRFFPMLKGISAENNQTFSQFCKNTPF